jgi:ADP-heptose:LPS heptosyltransferase
MNTAEAFKFLRRLQHCIAPPGSVRAKSARFIYGPIVGLIRQQARKHAKNKEAITADVVCIQDLGTEDFQYRPIRSIILFKLDHIGDLIVGMRAMRMIREGFPDARLTLVCASWNRTWAQQLGWFDDIITFDFFSPMNRNWTVTESDLLALYDQVRQLPLGSHDLAVDLRHDADTRPCLYRVDAKYRAGFFALPHEGLPHLDLLLPMTEGESSDGKPLKPVHADLRLRILAGAVVAAFGPYRPHPTEMLVPTRLGAPGRPFAVLGIGAGDPIRCWPIDRYAEVGRQLIARHDLDLVILGGAAEQADAATLVAALPQERVRTVLDKPLGELPELMAAAALCVCNGSGMSHLSASLGVPTVCILGGTTRMDVWYPAGARVVSIGGRTPCQPCALKLASECPWNVTCLTSITTAHVFAACERLLLAVDKPIPAEKAMAG